MSTPTPLTSWSQDRAGQGPTLAAGETRAKKDRSNAIHQVMLILESQVSFSGQREHLRGISSLQDEGQSYLPGVEVIPINVECSLILASHLHIRGETVLSIYCILRDRFFHLIFSVTLEDGCIIPLLLMRKQL